LKVKFQDVNNIKIIKADFLDINLPNNYPYKVFSNIPFNITTDIIRKLTNINNCPADSYLIVQKEPALKYLGKYGITMHSLLLKPFFDFKIVYEFHKFDFKPVPKVDAVLLHIKLRKDLLVEKKYYNKYQDFITYIFSNSHCNIKNAFKELFSYEQIKRLGQTHKFNINDNINSIDSNSWIELFNFFIKNIPKDKQNIIANKFRRFKKR
jgi:23S rRNA (adenine-N6)-dimethyltransferase